jgi:chromosome segregation ATPase
MDMNTVQNQVVGLKTELSQMEDEYDKIVMEANENTLKKQLYESRIKEISNEIKKLESEDMFYCVKAIEGFDKLLAITNGMDKTDYRQYNKDCPCWIDLERIVKHVIELKKHYPKWILDRVIKSGQIDVLPPETFYKFTYNTPEGYYMSCGGIEFE